MNWTQPGFVVVSDVGATGLPFVHGFHLTKWEADVARAKTGELPDGLTRNIRTIEATLYFDP